MLCSFPNSVPWSKLVRGLKTYLCFIGLCWRGLDLVWDAKNICRKIKKFPGPCANVCADSASSRSDQLDQSYLVRDQNWFWPHLLSTARSLNVFRAFKSKDTSTDEDEGQNTKSKKTFSFSIIFKERKMVTPTRIIQKNCSMSQFPVFLWCYGVFPRNLGQGISVTYLRKKLARTTWPETHEPRIIMRPTDKATGQSFFTVLRYH